MKSGDLDSRLTLLQRVDGPELPSGETPSRWAPLATVWAQKLEVRDSEKVNALAVGSVVSMRLRVRWSTTTSRLTVGDRVRLADADYALTGPPKEIGRREGLELTVARLAEVAADG